MIVNYEGRDFTVKDEPLTLLDSVKLSLFKDFIAEWAKNSYAPFMTGGVSKESQQLFNKIALAIVITKDIIPGMNNSKINEAIVSEVVIKLGSGFVTKVLSEYADHSEQPVVTDIESAKKK